MSRCTCTSHALEIFIKDLAGLNLRHLRSIPGNTHPRQNFSTRHPRRQLEAVSVVDDGFIPFELGQVKDGGQERKIEGRRNAQNKEREGMVDAEWHAEIEIRGAWPRRTSEVNTEAVAGEDIGLQEEVGDELARSNDGDHFFERTVDAVELRNVHPHLLSKAEPSIAVPSTPTPISYPARLSEASASAAGRSRAENRLARKQRRMLEGTWGPQRIEHTAQASAQEQAEEGADPVVSILQQIEKLPGLSHELEQRRQRQLGPAAEGGSVKKVRSAMKKAQHETGRESSMSGKKQPDRKAGEVKTEKAARSGSKETSKTKAAPAKSKPHPPEPWKVQKTALKAKFGEARWDPSKKLSPDTMNGVRALHASDPNSYTTATLAQHFEISPDAIRRILKSRWRPDEVQAERRRLAWEKRGVKKWEDMAAKGIKPPKQWRQLGVGWEKKSRSSTPKSARVGRVREPAGAEEAVGMLGGIESGFEERLN